MTRLDVIYLGQSVKLFDKVEGLVLVLRWTICLIG